MVQSRIQQALGRSAPYVSVLPLPVLAARAPMSSDIMPEGALFIDTSVTPNSVYTSLGNGDFSIGGNEPASTTTYGVVLLTDDNEPVATKFYADNLAIAGAPAWSETISGIGQLSTTAEATTGTNDDTAMTPLKVAQVLSGGGSSPSFTNVLISGTLGVTGLTSLNGSANIVTGATALNLGADASTGAINVGTGAGARTITVGNVTGATAVAVNTGTGSFTVTSTGAGDIVLNSSDTVLIDSAGVLELNSSAGVIGIGNDAVAQNINIGTGAAARVLTLGNSTGATQVVVNAGTAGINIGTNAVAHTVTIGNQTGASAVVIDSGTGPITIGTTIAKAITIGNVTGATGVAINIGTGNFALNGVAGSTYAVGAATTTGTITIGGTAQTGDLVLGSSSGTNAVKIANGSGASTVSIAAVQVAGAVNIGTAMTTGTITVGGTGLQTGTVLIAPGTGAQTVGIATGGTGIKTVNIATGAIGNVITMGTVTGAASMSLLVGTGNFDLEGNVASTYTISGTGVNTGTITIDGGTGARTINVANNTGIKTINIAGDSATSANIIKIGTGAAAQTVTIGSTNTTSALTLNAGSGNINATGGNLKIATTGKGLQVKGGAATDMCGTSVLTSGTVTIANTNIATGDIILLSRIGAAASTTLGVLSYTISNGASFTVTSLIQGTPGSTQTADVSTFSYVIVRPV